MAEILLNIDDLPFGIDNTQRRLIVQGTCRILPDRHPNGSLGTTFTYSTGGLRCRFNPLEPVKAATLLPRWVQFEPWLTWQYIYWWSPGYAVTAVAISSGIMTVTCNNTFQKGDNVQFQHIVDAATFPSPNATNAAGLLEFLENFPVTVDTASATNFTAKVGLPNLASRQCTGLAVGIGHTLDSYARVQAMMSGFQWQGVIRMYYTAITSGQGAGFTHGDQIEPGPIKPNAIQDLVAFRAEVMRSYF